MEDNRDVAGNRVPKLALLVSGASVFPDVVAVIPHLLVPWFKVFQANVTLSHPIELRPLLRHRGFPQLLGKHTVESLGFLFEVIAKDIHTILAPIEL